jgi:hypothetical protein
MADVQSDVSVQYMLFGRVVGAAQQIIGRPGRPGRSAALAFPTVNRFCVARFVRAPRGLDGAKRWWPARAVYDSIVIQLVGTVDRVVELLELLEATQQKKAEADQSIRFDPGVSSIEARDTHIHAYEARCHTHVPCSTMIITTT